MGKMFKELQEVADKHSLDIENFDDFLKILNIFQKSKTMKKVQKCENALHIISEPGDSTHYDYVVIKTCETCFKFFAYDNEFEYPPRLEYYQVKNINTERDAVMFLREMTAYFGGIWSKVNPYTLLECVRTVKELVNDK